MTNEQFQMSDDKSQIKPIMPYTFKPIIKKLIWGEEKWGLSVVEDSENFRTKIRRLWIPTLRQCSSHTLGIATNTKIGF